MAKTPKDNLKKMKGKPGGYGKSGGKFKGTRTEEIYSDMTLAKGRRNPPSAEKAGTKVIGARNREIESIEDYRDRTNRKKKK